MFRNIFAGLWLLVIPTIAMAETRVSFDRGKPFYAYKTFTVEVSPPIDAYGDVDEDNTLAENSLREAVTRQLQARGLEPTDVGADLTVRVSSREVEQTVLVGNGWGYPYGYGYGYGYPGYWRAGYWGGWGGVWTYNYIEGIVKIDVIENNSGDLVYRAEHSDDLNKDLDKEMSKAVRHSFRKYPVEPFYAD